DFNYYWETLPPKDSQLRKASEFFMKAAAPPQFLTSIAKFRMFPESDVPEVAFVGRSNVGKSSLLNAMVNANIKDILARTSKTPGCTKTMNLYGVGGLKGGGGVRIKKGNGQFNRVSGRGGLVIVDLPGYGEGSHQEWGAEIMKYLSKRKQLRRVFVLISAKEGVMPSDQQLLSALRENGVPHQVLLSKLDKIYVPSAEKLVRVASRQGGNAGKAVPKGNFEDVRKKMQGVREQVQGERGGGALGELLGVSSEVSIEGKRMGMDAVRVAVLRAVGL
ncbi:GTP-binding protein engB, partial [Lophiotrema nucula]